MACCTRRVRLGIFYSPYNTSAKQTTRCAADRFNMRWLCMRMRHTRFIGVYGLAHGKLWITSEIHPVSIVSFTFA